MNECTDEDENQQTKYKGIHVFHSRLWFILSLSSLLSSCVRLPQSRGLYGSEKRKQKDVASLTLTIFGQQSLIKRRRGRRKRRKNEETAKARTQRWNERLSTMYICTKRKFVDTKRITTKKHTRLRRRRGRITFSDSNSRKIKFAFSLPVSPSLSRFLGLAVLLVELGWVMKK